MPADLLHVDCYHAKHSRNPLRVLQAKKASACPMCSLLIVTGADVAYDVVPPVARPRAASPVPVPATASESTIMQESTTSNGTTSHATPAIVPAPDMASLTGLIGAAIAPIVDAAVKRALGASCAPSVDENRVKQIAADCFVAGIAALDRPTRIEIVDTRPGADATPVDLGLTHAQFPELLSLVRAGKHVWLYGAAGSGKTYVVSQIAKALGRTYRMQGAIADRYADLVGYKSVTTGEYQRTSFRDSLEHGGVHLIDEIDASQDPGSPLAINAALANHKAPFADGLIDRHPDFVLIACANTKGFGADADYVGRIRFDAAFLDRFVCLEWRTDEKLERALWPNAAKRVQEIRARVRARGIKVLVTPRASERLSALLGSGLDEARAERLAIGGLMTDDQWGQVK